MLYQPQDQNPSVISHVKHDTTTLSDLMYLSLVLDLDSLNIQVPCDSHISQLSVTTGHRLHPSSSVPKCFSGNQRNQDWVFKLI